MNNHIARGIVSGFLATVILSICFFIKSAAGIVPEANAITALVKVSTIWLGSPLAPWVGWVEHFFIGTVLWGIAFAVVEPMMPEMGLDKMAATAAKGFVFSIGAWIVFEILLMPPAGAGWFAANLGSGALLAALVLHIIWGVSLGAIYGALTPANERAHSRVPSHRSPDIAPQPSEPGAARPQPESERSRERVNLR